jgi:uncharacterized protein (UPF0261 family)
VVVPGCIDFAVFATGTVPGPMQDRPVYDHNPEYTLVRTSHDEMVQLGDIFAERLNVSESTVVIAVPTEGLSIPSTPDGPFWDQEADAAFLARLREGLRDDIAVHTYARHVNSPEFGLDVADLFLQMMARQ